MLASKSGKRFATLAVGALCALMAAVASATMVLQMDLAALVGNADKVFRGTITDVSPGTVNAGGAALPTVIYTLRVDDVIKGTIASEKDVTTIRVEMLGSIKPQVATGDMRRLTAIDMNPKLDVGSSYVLFTTAPSAIGLSTTVGLHQGLFRVFNNAQGREMTANGLDNQGLFDGAVPYAELKSAIEAELN